MSYIHIHLCVHTGYIIWNLKYYLFYGRISCCKNVHLCWRYSRILLWGTQKLCMHCILHYVNVWKYFLHSIQVLYNTHTYVLIRFWLAYKFQIWDERSQLFPLLFLKYLGQVKSDLWFINIFRWTAVLVYIGHLACVCFISVALKGLIKMNFAHVCVCL